MDMKILAGFLIIVFALASCKNDSLDKAGNNCGVKNPTEDLSWLKQEISKRDQNLTDLNKYFFIQQAEYEGQTVFVYSNCCPFCDTMLLVYNCEGVLLQSSDNQKIINSKVIYRPSDFKCQL